MPSTILVIDDDEKMRELVSDILVAFDYRVIPAENSEEGLALALLQHPDMILCDVMLPDALGFDTARAFNEHPSTRAVPVVLMTGHHHMQGHQKMGSWKLLLKPVSMRKILEAVQDALECSAEATIR